ncbi:MAG: Tetratricopeptide 2 repeat protein [Myxococcales bacterium]|nr:Tetratricopeptide 2 repeat protein [Myxococcales bacterium]
MAEEERTRRWQRTERSATVSDTIQLVRSAIVEVRTSPQDPEARRRLRALAAEHGLWDQLALLLSDEARAAVDRPTVAVAFYEELVDVHESLDQPLEMITAMEAVIAIEPEDVEHHDRLAWLYRRAGAWSKAASAFERVGELAQDDRGRAALRAAGKLYRDNGRFDQAAAVYRTIVERRPSDRDAWRALDDVLVELGRWREVAEVRGQRAALSGQGVEKAALLRSQARALEQAGDLQGAAGVVATASQHAPENVSGLVDYADVLARSGQGREAAGILATRVTEAIERGASPEDVAALRMRLAGILEDACADRPAAAAQLAELLAEAPEYLPALERITAHAASDPDPRVHAAALLRYAAALPDDSDRSGYISVAGRRFRDARDFGAAVNAFEQAVELAPADDDLRRELEDARTSLLVERARSEAAAGDTGPAERRLRGILTAQRHHVEANLALTDLLSRTGRNQAAADHLRATLAEAPETADEKKLALLVHRFAAVTAALGDDDESHQLLHEAHRLDRTSLPITLALGESCFARKLWRQASLHLGALAEHPDASQHAPAVATGLVRAAQAEIRALRPANAHKHYETAVKIDPGCAPAWHAIAEAASARGDLNATAAALEHEAFATTHPKDRVRLFDALGDMAIDVLGDPARAERCWSQIVDAGHPRVLEKLLTVQRARGAVRERAATCEYLAAAVTEPRRSKELLEEAAEAHAAGGDRDRAVALAEQLIAKYPRDLTTIACATAVAVHDPRRVAGWLRPALTAWETQARADDRGEQDPRRAELWRRLGDAERDLGQEPAALVAYQKAVNAAPDSPGALAARRGLVALASSTGRNHHSSLIALVEADQAPTEVVAWARSLMRSGDTEDARAAFELARAVGAPLGSEDEDFLTAYRPRIMASDEAYSAALDDADRRELIDDPAEGPLAGVLELLGEVLPLVCPNANTALVEANLMDAKRLPSTSDAATAALYPQIAKALGGPATLLFVTPRAGAPDATLLLASPPVVVLGPRLASIRAGSRSDIDLAGDTALRFQLGRLVELSRPRRVFAGGQSIAAFTLLVAALRHAFGPATETPARDVIAEAERLRGKLPVAVRQRMTEKLRHGDAALDPQAYSEACHRAADRAGLLACGDVTTAIELAGGSQRAAHLVRLAGSQRYLAARRKLRARGLEATTER